jgi:ribosome biogenesis GTPase
MTSNLVQSLSTLGWTPFFEAHTAGLSEGKCLPARVVGVRKNSFTVSQGEGAWLATVSGRLSYQTGSLFPVAGDWVLVNDTLIVAVLPRRNALSRGAAGGHNKREMLPMREQVIAANLDSVFIVCGMDRDFNLRRIERYLTLVYNSGLNPVIILTKSDLHQDPQPLLAGVEDVAFGVPVHVTSARTSQGLEHLEAYLSPGQTVTMLGSSGAGKSTIVNRLCGRPIQATASVSQAVGKGTHTTTSRDLIMMPQGGMLIDNPGIREIAFWEADRGVERAFPEIENLASACRFADCEHMHEPGCQVKQAVMQGELTQARVDSYHKMKRELMYLSDRQHKSADRVEKERWKGVALKLKALKRRDF